MSSAYIQKSQNPRSSCGSFEHRRHYRGTCLRMRTYPGWQVRKMSRRRHAHWSVRAYQSLIRRNKDGNFCLNIDGGAENGEMPYIGLLRQDRINYEKGKIETREILLEVNGERVPGMTRNDVIALIERSASPVSLVTVTWGESSPRSREGGGGLGLWW